MSAEAEKIMRKGAEACQKPGKRITQLAKQGTPCFLFQLDTLVIYWNNLKRGVLAGVDHAAKLGYAPMQKK